MPGSYDYFKTEVRDHILKHLDKQSYILDVGPGYGTYGNLLKPEYTNIDAVEVWEPYVDMFNLKNIYKEVHISNILDFDYSKYDYIIMGDVLEHIDLKNAQNLISDITKLEKHCIVAVPYMYPQGSHEGNDFEAHLQPDITPDNFIERYPEMKCLFKNDLYGYYINY